jgi:hypothetical protein
MDTWTPLFSSIIASSIWGESPVVKIVWVTMLAIKDRNGFVSASVPGLARLAVVPVDECRAALKVLESPDKDSKCPDHEGRRIKTVENGWLILGHERFIQRMRAVSSQIGNAKRQARHRQQKRLIKLPTDPVYPDLHGDGRLKEEPPAYGNGI